MFWGPEECWIQIYNGAAVCTTYLCRNILLGLGIWSCGRVHLRRISSEVVHAFWQHRHVIVSTTRVFRDLLSSFGFNRNDMLMNLIMMMMMTTMTISDVDPFFTFHFLHLPLPFSLPFHRLPPHPFGPLFSSHKAATTYRPDGPPNAFYCISVQNFRLHLCG